MSFIKVGIDGRNRKVTLAVGSRDQRSSKVCPDVQYLSSSISLMGGINNPFSFDMQEGCGQTLSFAKRGLFILSPSDLFKSQNYCDEQDHEQEIFNIA